MGKVRFRNSLTSSSYADVVENPTGSSKPLPESDTAAQGSFARLRSGADGERLTFVAVLGIARFEHLRRSLGYQVAASILSLVATRLSTVFRDAELGRIGRTRLEFAFHADGQNEAEAVLAAVIPSLQKPYIYDGMAFSLGVALGVTKASNGRISDELIEAGANALDRAWSAPSKIAFADAQAADGSITYDIELLRDLRSASGRGELTLYYQPKLHSRLDRITSAEALLRWDHPRWGRIPTEKFIALAEDTGSIRELTEWVLAEAIRGQDVMRSAGHDLEVHINISGTLLHDDVFAHAALAVASTATGNLGFEITETAVIEEPESALANLHAFSKAGIKIAIDDYGSGLSSLAYLKQLPAQELKIDRMFISGLIDSHKDPLLVRSSIDLAHALEMEVTAEGVDDAMSLSLLRVMGCDLLQGYLIAPPLPLPEFLDLLADKVHLQSLVGPPASGSAWSSFKRVQA